MTPAAALFGYLMFSALTVYSALKAVDWCETH